MSPKTPEIWLKCGRNFRNFRAFCPKFYENFLAALIVCETSSIHDLATNFWWLKLIPIIIRLNLESTLFYHSVAIYSHQKNILSINFLVILLLKTSFSRNFCQQSVRVNFPQCWKMKNEKIFRQINFFSKNVTFTKFLQNKSVKVSVHNFHNVCLLCLMTFIPWNQLYY